MFKSTYRHGNLKNALVVAAAEFLCSHDVRELSLRELAKSLGVSTAAPYSHFIDKEDLLNAVADEGFRLLRDALAETTAVKCAANQQLTRVVRTYLSWSQDNPGFYKVMFQSSSSRKHQDDEGKGFAYQTLDILLQVVQGVSSKRLSKRIARERAMMLCSLIHGVVALNDAGPFTKINDSAALAEVAAVAASRMLKAQKAEKEP